MCHATRIPRNQHRGNRGRIFACAAQQARLIALRTVRLLIDVGIEHYGNKLVASGEIEENACSNGGRNKADVMAERIRDINPDTKVTALARFYEEDDLLDLTAFDWVIDAIDSVLAKTALIKTAVEKDINIVSAMGAAGKFDTQFKVADISKTSTCPLAKVMRKRLREIGIEHLPVVYSEEKPVPREGDLGTLSYVPGSAGLCLAGYVIRSIVVQ